LPKVGSQYTNVRLRYSLLAFFCTQALASQAASGLKIDNTCSELAAAGEAKLNGPFGRVAACGEAVFNGFSGQVAAAIREDRSNGSSHDGSSRRGSKAECYIWHSSSK